MTGLNFVVLRSIDIGEIIMAPQCLPTPFTNFYVFYYNLLRGNYRSVKIFGLPDYDAFNMSCNDVTVTNHVENICFYVNKLASFSLKLIWLEGWGG